MSRRVERRLRLRRREEVGRGLAKMNPRMMEELGITTELEVVIAGKKRYRFRVLSDESVPEREVWCNEEELREYGIADNTVATCRAPLESQSG